MNKIKNIPTPIAGLALGSMAVGNVFQVYSKNIQILFAYLAIFIIFLLTIKFMLNFKTSLRELVNPVVATVFATFPMSIMLISSFLKQYLGNNIIVLWGLGVFLDILVVSYVFYSFILTKRNISYIYPTWFITFVGPAVVTVTAKGFGLEYLGHIFFYFSFINYLVLVPFILYRVYSYKNLKDGEYPTITVFAAPGGLLLASYMIGFSIKDDIILEILVPMTIFFYIFVLAQLKKLLSRKFYPSFSAFTFPLVICAMAFQKTYQYFDLMNKPLEILVHISELIAILIVIYVAIKYLQFLLKL